MMSMKKKIICLVLATFMILVLLNIMTSKPTSKKISNYIEKKGYKNEAESNLYYKQITELSLKDYQEKIKNNLDAEYEKRCFILNEYSFTQTQLTYTDGVETDFTPKYSYKTDKMTYQYKVSVNSIALIFSGEYQKKSDKFTCKNIYDSNIKTDIDKATFCEKIKYDVQEFYYEATKLIDNATLINEMKK